LIDEDEEQQMRKLHSDVAHIKPSRSTQSLAIFWKGEDIRLAHVQEKCLFHFSWQPKSADWQTNQVVGTYKVVSKEAFTIGGVRLVTVGSDATPNLDVITCGNLILCYISNEVWLKHRKTEDVRAYRRTADNIRNTKEQLERSAVQLANGDTQGAIKTVTTRELMEMVQSGDKAEMKDMLDDGFPSTTIQI
jgi:hypothetical protein